MQSLSGKALHACAGLRTATDVSWMHVVNHVPITLSPHFNVHAEPPYLAIYWFFPAYLFLCLEQLYSLNTDSTSLQSPMHLSCSLFIGRPHSISIYLLFLVVTCICLNLIFKMHEPCPIL